MTKPLAIVIEDCEPIRKMNTMLLTNAGFEVQPFSTVDDAVTALGGTINNLGGAARDNTITLPSQLALTPSLIVSDNETYEKGATASGLALMEALHGLPTPIPAILMSGNGELRSFDGGKTPLEAVNPYAVLVQKPASLKEFRSAISEAREKAGFPATIITATPHENTGRSL